MLKKNSERLGSCLGLMNYLYLPVNSSKKDALENYDSSVVDPSLLAVQGMVVF